MIFNFVPQSARRHTRTALLLAGLFLFVAAFSSPAKADAFPSRPITLVVANVAGGSADFVARALAPHISAKINQPVVVEDKPGGTGVVGERAVITAPADGYTLLLNTVATIIVGPQLSDPPAFDPLTDLTPIVPLASTPALLVVRPGLGVRSFAELVDYAKKNPGKLTAGSSGAGTLSALNVALLQKEVGIKILHVPYKGAPPVISDMLGGRIDLMFSDVSFFQSLVEANQLNALLAASPVRLAALPDVPTAKELGYPTLVAANVYSLYGPPGMDGGLVQTINRIFREALDDKSLQASLLSQGMIAQDQDAGKFAQAFKDESQRYTALLQMIGTPAEK
jgi:tripartite-type tricarboxylate transporter receptor subunit TctC